MSIAKLVTKNTDPMRRAALQIALQLPEDITEARAILDQASEILETYLIVGPRLAQQVEQAKRVFVPPPSRMRATAIIIALLALTAPPAGFIAGFSDNDALMFILTAGIVSVSLVLGRRYGVFYACLASLAYNFFFSAPLLHFSVPTPEEIVGFVGFVSFAFFVPWMAKAAYPLRQLATGGKLIETLTPTKP